MKNPEKIGFDEEYKTMSKSPWKRIKDDQPVIVGMKILVKWNEGRDYYYAMIVGEKRIFMLDSLTDIFSFGIQDLLELNDCQWMEIPK